MTLKILKRRFYDRDTLKVAQDLLGKILYRKVNGKILSGKIVETEGYLQNDKACHAARGKTPKNEVMFGPPGHAYVYFIYGMYHCLNAVTRPEGIGEAVLIRAVEPIENIKEETNGPGKLCRAFDIDKSLNGVDLTKGDFVILDSDKQVKVKRATRIGIKEDADKLWRFYTESDFVSIIKSNV